MKQKKNSPQKDAVILLSGGLDCVCALSEVVKNYKSMLAITFDYGQKAYKKELFAAKNICKFYKIKHKTIKLNWLKNITKTALVSDKKIPKNVDIDEFLQTVKSSENVWVPNRNSVFINIAAAFLDAKNGGDVVIGANSEEAQTFSDNSKEFINAVNKSLKLSCNGQIQVVAPLISMNKNQIVKLGIKNSIPFNLINSCYEKNEGHCGECESCLRLKKALKANKCENLVKFGKKVP